MIGLAASLRQDRQTRNNAPDFLRYESEYRKKPNQKLGFLKSRPLTSDHARRRWEVDLKHDRRAIGMTQEALAERVDVSIETIGKIERGVAAQSFDTVERIAAALRLPPLALSGIGVGEEAAPKGERGGLLARISATPSGMNEEQVPGPAPAIAISPPRAEVREERSP